ncbi:hypothetical protein [Spirosoma foliorum]|uniref:Phage tail tape measure protein n=1 Tax=Spirosoma foliorum TaxID=2710596 RepID=A0A7G5GUD9_9BACT|nr:hypothetical protein [Spirosoma foliorum]QMW02481.1 hypothetical protein H3H32_31995 [Spirosoma foliorum]
MEQPIGFKDLADYDGIMKSLANLSTASQKLGENSEATIDGIKKALTTLMGVMGKYQAQLQTLRDSSEAPKMVAGFVETATAIRANNTLLAQHKTAVDSNNRVIDQMQSRLSALQKEYDKLDLSQKQDIQRKKEIERELVQNTRAINALASATNSAARTVKAAEGSNNALKQSVAALKNELNAMPDAYKKGTGEINEQNKAAVKLNAQYQEQVTLLGKIEKGQQIHNRNVGNYPKGSGALNALGDLTGLGGMASAAGIGAVIASAGGAVLEIGQQYEKLNLLTENALNNNKKAAVEANAIIRDFADHSPLEMDKVTEAFNRLVDIGIIPTKEQLTEISDMAISKNKDITDYVELIADAQQGQFDRLAEFSINATKSGDKVIFTYKGVRTEVANNSKAISDYLIGLGKVQGTMGATEKLAQTFSGRWSTLKDTTKGIASDLYQTFLPALNGVLGALNWGIGIVGGFVKGLKQMAQEQGILTTIFKFVASPLAATTEAYQARARAPKAADPNQTPELDKLRKQQEAQNKINDANRKQAEAEEKAKKDADKILNEKLSNSKAANDQLLASNEAAQQDGLISERDFIKQRQKITIDGINERQAILTKAGKKETDDYKKLNTERLDAQTQYKRDLLKLNLADSKSDASKAIAGLGRDREDGTITDLAYIEAKRGILVASLNEQKQILQQAGQGQSQLAKDIDQQLLEVDRDYFRDKLKLLKTGWKEELDLTREELKAINENAASEYDEALVKINQFYNEKRKLVRRDIDAGKISDIEGGQLLGRLDIQELQDQIKAAQVAYDKDQFNSNILTESKIKQLEKYKAAAAGNAKEVAAYDEQIAALKKAREQDAVNDTIALNKKKADNTIAQSNRADANDEENTKKQKARRQQLTDTAIEIGRTLVDGLFDNQQQETQNKLTQLDRQKASELAAVQDNEAAKAAIEAKYTAQKNQLMHQQDVANRNKAIFDIVINTAVAVSKVIANPILAALVGALGAVQLGLVMSRQLPQYFAGKNIDGITNDSYAGPAIAGERGRELWQHDGRIDLVDKPSLINVGRNDVILPNYMTEHILQSNAIVSRSGAQAQIGSRLVEARDQHQGRQFARAISLDRNSISVLAKAIGEANKNLPFNHTTFDAHGVATYIQEANSRRLIQQNKHRLGNKPGR